MAQVICTFIGIFALTILSLPGELVAEAFYNCDGTIQDYPCGDDKSSGAFLRTPDFPKIQRKNKRKPPEKKEAIGSSDLPSDPGAVIKANPRKVKAKPDDERTEKDRRETRRLIKNRPDPDMEYRVEKYKKTIKVKGKVTGYGKVKVSLRFIIQSGNHKSFKQGGSKSFNLPEDGGSLEFEIAARKPIGFKNAPWELVADNTGSSRGYHDLSGCCGVAPAKGKKDEGEEENRVFAKCSRNGDVRCANGSVSQSCVCE